MELKDLKDELIKESLDFFKGEWPLVKEYVEKSLEGLMATFRKIKEMELSGEITPDEAIMHLEMYKDSVHATFLAGKVLAKVEVERYLNRILKVASNVVNRYLGFPLI